MLPNLGDNTDKIDKRYLVDRNVYRKMRGRRQLRSAFNERFPGNGTAQLDYENLSVPEQKKHQELNRQMKENPSGPQFSQRELRMAARALTGLDKDQPPLLFTNNAALEALVKHEGGDAHSGVTAMKAVQERNPKNRLVHEQAKHAGHEMHRERQKSIDRFKNKQSQNKVGRNRQQNAQRLNRQRQRNRRIRKQLDRTVEEAPRDVQKYNAMKKRVEHLKQQPRRVSKTGSKMVLKRSEKTHNQHDPIRRPEHQPKIQQQKQQTVKQQQPKRRQPQYRQQPQQKRRQYPGQQQYQNANYGQPVRVVYDQPMAQQQQRWGQQMDQQRYQMQPQMQYQQQYAYQMGPAQYQQMQMVQMYQTMMQMQRFIAQMMMQMQQQWSVPSMGSW